MLFGLFSNDVMTANTTLPQIKNKMFKKRKNKTKTKKLMHNNKADDYSSESSRSHAHLIRFADEVEVHEHCMVLGDHPDATTGPPTQLGWCYETKIDTLHDKSSKPVEPISEIKRRQIILASGATIKEIELAIYELQSVQLSRRDNLRSSINTPPQPLSFNRHTANLVKRAGSTKGYKATAIKGNKTVASKGYTATVATKRNAAVKQSYKDKSNKGIFIWR